MRTPLRMLLTVLTLTAYANGLPYSHTPDYFASQQSVEWYGDRQEQQQQQQQDNSFFETLSHSLPQEQVAEVGIHWDKPNPPALYLSPSDINSGLTSQNTDVSDFISFPQSEEEPLKDDGLTVSCTGENKFCVNKDHCINGYARSLQENFIYDKSQIQQCNLQYEVCCIVKDYHEQSSSDAGNVHVPAPKPDYHDLPPVIDDQKYVNPVESDQRDVFIDSSPSQEVETPVKNDEEHVASPTTDFVKGAIADSGVAQSPPITKISSTSFEQPTKDVKGSGVTSATVRPVPTSQNSETTGFKAHVQLGCAAALLCVEEQFCTKEGVISTQPIVFTEKDILRRVPLSSCKDPESGIIGKCCRDPNYVDPWPTGNLPANYSGGFDEQGFPTFLNIAKVRPPKKQISVTKTTPTVKPSIRPPPLPNNEFSTIKTPTTEEPVPQYKDKYEIPDFSINIPQRVIVPPLPSQNPPTIIETHPIVLQPSSKNDYEFNTQDSIPIIPKHIPNECGVRNNVLHTDELETPITSFGEIPWQAMILSNEYRTILCSGVIIAPNLVLTTAYCVNGITPQEIAVKSGEWKLGYELKHEEPLPFEITNVSSIVIHPNYVVGSSLNDIAALFLEHPVAYDTHVNPLCLPNLTQTKTFNRCIVTGWGQAVIKVHALGAIMNSLNVNVLPFDICTQRASQQYNIKIEHETICVKSQNINYNMCQTEIGAPLACQRQDGIYELAGLYSQDNGCSPTHQVAVFSPIDNDWLNKLMYNAEQSISFSTLSTKDDLYSHKKSHLPSATKQYLPPV